MDKLTLMNLFKLTSLKFLTEFLASIQPPTAVKNSVFLKKTPLI